MDFNEYQKRAREKAVYPTLGGGVVFPTLGMVGEAGEVAEKVKKIFRDDAGEISEEKKREIQKELGDVLWYLAQIAAELEIDLDDVATENLAKIESRHNRQVVHGDGDNR